MYSWKQLQFSGCEVIVEGAGEGLASSGNIHVANRQSSMNAHGQLLRLEYDVLEMKWTNLCASSW